MSEDSDRDALRDSSAQLQSASYRVPIADLDFQLRDEMRGVRLMLEYAKADLLLREAGIRSTIIVFGSSRAPSPEAAELLLRAASPAHGAATVQRIQRQVAWYEAARCFARLASKEGGALGPSQQWRDNVIATGGGPGIMEAANRGARDVGAPSIGFNIMLPAEQLPNPYTTPELTFRFHYFAMRKLHLALRANALAVFPGGFGTMDELFEMLTLRQTHKARAVPILLYDSHYWQKIINWSALVDEGLISNADLELLDFADTPQAAWQSLVRRGLTLRSSG